MKKRKQLVIMKTGFLSLLFLAGAFMILLTGCPQDPDILPPGEVTSLTASAGDTRVTLLWEEPVDEDYDHALVSSVPAAFNPLEVTSGVTSVIIGELANDEEYTFLVKTVDTLGNTSEGTTVTATPTTNYPTVSSTSPAAGATAAARSGPITVTFSSAMNGDTIDEESITLKTGGVTIPVNITFSGAVATVTPVDTLAANTLYVLTVKSTVTDIEGHPLTGGYSMSFTTASSATWSSAEFVEDLWGISTVLPRVALDDQGRGFCVFKGSNDIYAVRYTAAGWETPEVIDNQSTTIHHTARIALDGDGNAIALWSQYDGDNYRIMWSYYDETAGTWSTADTLDTDNAASHNAYTPAITFDTDGNAMAVWLQDASAGTGTYNLYARGYDAASGWDAAVTTVDASEDGQYLNSNPDYYPVDLACDGNGNVIAVWIKYDGSSWNQTNAARWDGSSWTVTQLSTDSASDRYPSVACDSSNKAVAVWRSNTTTIKESYFDGSAWSSEADLSTGGNTIVSTDVAFSANGDCVAVWTQHGGTYYDLYANRRPAGGTWPTSGTLVNAGTQHCYTPRLVLDAGGNAVALWSQYYSTGSMYDAYGCAMTGGSWGTPASLEDWNGSVYSDASSERDNLDIALLPGGNALAVWCQQDGTNLSIFYSVYSR